MDKPLRNGWPVPAQRGEPIQHLAVLLVRAGPLPGGEVRTATPNGKRRIGFEADRSNFATAVAKSWFKSARHCLEMFDRFDQSLIR